MRKAARWPQAHRNGCGKAAAQDSQQKGSRKAHRKAATQDSRQKGSRTGAAAVTKLRPASVRCGAEFFVSVLRRAAPERRASDAQHMTEVAATDEVDVGYTLHDRRCGRCRSPSPAAACVIPRFQFSMLLHNLSSIFSLGKKAASAPRAAPASRTARPPQRASQKRPPHPHRPKARSRLGPTKSARQTAPGRKPTPHPHIPPVGTAPCSAAPGRRQNRRLPHRIHALAHRSCPPLRLRRTTPGRKYPSGRPPHPRPPAAA